MRCAQCGCKECCGADPRMAAADEMYEALDEAVKDLICTRNSAWHAAQTDPRWEGVSDVLEKRINACKAALTKAQGETKGDDDG